MESILRLFRNTSVFSALSTLVRQTEEGDATDSRATMAARLIEAGAARQAAYDEILGGFVSDPAIVAAAVSGIAGASLPPATIESLLAAPSIRALRKLTRDFDPATIETDDANLRAFLDDAARVGRTSDPKLEDIEQVMAQLHGIGPDGRAWLMLVAGHLTLLRADRKVRPLIYPRGR